VADGYRSCPEEREDVLLDGMTRSMRELRLQAVKNYRFSNCHQLPGLLGS